MTGNHDRRCTATSKQTGKRCGAWAIPGGTVCKWHGGNTPNAKKAAAQRLQEDQARTDAARFAARTDIYPADALLELVQYQAGIVVYWRGRVEDVNEDDLVWGETKREKGIGPEGPIDKSTSEAAPHIAYRLLTEAQDKLAAYAAAALKAGVDERRVRLAEQQGALVAQVIRGVLTALNLTPEQEALVPRVVPEQLRLLTAESDRP